MEEHLAWMGGEQINFRMLALQLRAVKKLAEENRRDRPKDSGPCRRGEAADGFRDVVCHAVERD